MSDSTPRRLAGLDKAAAAFLAPAQADDEIGRLAHYRVLKVLGKGGMGMVFRGEDPTLQRPVALKIMLPEMAKRGSAKERFLREARAAAAIEHEHIIPIYFVGEDRGIPFIAMSLLKGMSLDDWLKQKRPLSIPQILRIGRETAKGLQAAHERGLIHRDIKPANLWLDAGAKGRVKILDFGLARQEAEDTGLTRSGQIIGTPAYMSPEQAAGDKLDVRSDLFSLGVVLYRLVAGQLPFQGINMMAMLTALATQDPAPVTSLNAETPPALASLIHRLLEKDRSKRPATAKEVVDAIAAIERERILKKLGAEATAAIISTPSAGKAESSRTIATTAASQALSVEDSEESQITDDDFRAASSAATISLTRSSPPRWRWPALLGGVAAVVIAVGATVIAMRGRGPEQVSDRDPLKSPAVIPTPSTKPPVNPPVNPPLKIVDDNGWRRLFDGPIGEIPPKYTKPGKSAHFQLVERDGERILIANGEGMIVVPKVQKNYHLRFQMRRTTPGKGEFMIPFHQRRDCAIYFRLGPSVAWISINHPPAHFSAVHAEIRDGAVRAKPVAYVEGNITLKNNQWPGDEWNVVELICLDDTAVFVVNQQVIGALTKLRMKDPNDADNVKATEGPLDWGQLAFMANTDRDIELRRIEVRDIRSLPALTSSRPTPPFDGKKVQDEYAKRLGQQVDEMLLRLIPPGGFTMGSAGDVNAPTCSCES